MPKSSGLYIVRLLNEEPMPVTRDPRHVDTCARVTSANLIVGKAHNLEARRKGFWRDLDAENVLFEPLALVDTRYLVFAKKSALASLQEYRMAGTKGRDIHWLEGISYEDAKARVFHALDEAGIPYARVD